MPAIPFAGVQKLAATTTAQPVFGTTTTAASVPVYDQFAGNVQGANPSMTTLTVASTAGFGPGRYVLVGSTYQLGGVTPNMGQVKAVVSSTSMTVEGLNQSVANGAYVLLAEEAQSVTIKPVVGNSAVIYVGDSPSVSSSATNVIDIIPNPSNTTYAFNYFHLETTDRGHAHNTSQFWVSGTVSDAFLAWYTQG